MQNQTDTTPKQEQPIQKVQKIKKDLKQKVYKFQVPKTKFELIRAILVRWWYGMAPWPQTEDYTQKLKDQNLIEVTESEVQQIDENIQGIKVYRLENFPGMFCNSTGNLFDLRNNDQRPSFNNLRKKDNKALAKLLLQCIKGQIQQLQNSPYYENNLDYALRKFLRRFSRVYKPFLDE